MGTEEGTVLVHHTLVTTRAMRDFEDVFGGNAGRERDGEGGGGGGHGGGGGSGAMRRWV